MKKDGAQNTYTMEDILLKSATAEETRKQEIEDELYDTNRTGKRNTRNQILKSCEQEENFKRWKKEMMKEAKKTETKADDKYVSCLKQTSELFQEILYDEGNGLDDSMPDYGTLTKYM